MAVLAAAALLAWLLGRPILRLKGHYLAMATLGMGIIISIVVATEDRITGGPDGDLGANEIQCYKGRICLIIDGGWTAR